MKSLLTAATATMLLAGAPALADTIDDPLHSYIVQGGVNVNTDNGLLSPAALANPAISGFGFFASPAPQTGALTIAVLIPTNEVFGGFPTVSGTLAGALTPHVGTWTSGDLATFLGFANASPSNPFSAFASPDTADPNGIPTGFTVFSVSFSNDTLTDLTLSTMLEHVSSLPAGAEIAAFLNEGDHVVSTAPSGVLEVTPFAAVPGPVAGAGLPGLALALLGLWSVRQQRRRNQGV